MNNNRYLYGVTLLVLLMCGMMARAGSIKITSSGNGKYAVGQTFTIQVECRDVSGSLTMPSQVPGCRIVSNMQGTSVSYSSTSAGMKRDETTTISLQVMPQSPGSFTFGPVTAGGTKSNTISYSISGQAAPAPSGTSAVSPISTGGSAPSISQGMGPLSSYAPYLSDDDIVLRAVVSDASPYMQQGVKYTVRLYTRVGVASPQYGFPKFENCVYEELPDVMGHTLEPATLNGKQYNAIDLYSLIVYPTKAGKCTLEGGECYLTIDALTTVPVKANTVELNVRELPDAAAHSELNGVGDYEVSASLSTDAMHTNQPSKLIIKVEGKGNPTFVSLPDIKGMLPEGFKLVKTDSSIDKRVDYDGIYATITYECVVIPSREGDTEIAAIPFTFFNPKTGEWYTAITKPISVRVEKGAESHEGGAEYTFTDSMAPIQGLQSSYGFSISSPIYWALYLLTVVALVVAYMMWRKRRILESDTQGMRRRKAGKGARRRLSKAYDAMRHDAKDQFYDEVLKAMYGYLGDKLGRNVSELSRTQISEALQAYGVPEQSVSDIIAIIDDCEYAKYASVSDSDMTRIYEGAVNAIDGMEEMIGAQQK